MKLITKKLLFEYPLSRFEIITFLLLIGLVSATGSHILTTLAIAWILTCEYATKKLQKLWKGHYEEDKDE